MVTNCATVIFLDARNVVKYEMRQTNLKKMKTTTDQCILETGTGFTLVQGWYCVSNVACLL